MYLSAGSSAEQAQLRFPEVHTAVIGGRFQGHGFNQVANYTKFLHI